MPARFRGNLQLLGLLQEDYDKDASMALREEGLQQRGELQQQSLDIREQALQAAEAAQGFRQEHQDQMQALTAKSAELHDQEISTKLAQESATMDRELAQRKEEAGAWKAVAGLEPKTPDYPAQVAGIASQYPAAFAKAGDETENGLLSHVAGLDKIHETWSTMSQKAADEQARMAYGTGPEREKYATILGNIAQFKAASETETDPDKKAGYASQYAGAQAMEAEFRRQFPAVASGVQPSAAPASTPANGDQPSTAVTPAITPSFDSEDAAFAASRAGKINHGDKIIVSGTDGTWGWGSSFVPTTSATPASTDTRPPLDQFLPKQ